MRDNGHPYNLEQSTTLQRQLRQGGYRTGLFGKYLNSWTLSDNPPGFDSWLVLKPTFTTASTTTTAPSGRSAGTRPTSCATGP
ncbi:Choline-sulfatase [Alloactinosynnema sp. L-07]|uniref:hypothetical protein n=1 Tax=Alloactinosynnema sp. L-07 TaxID=1653480 RepID=UPI00065EFC7A|nr:hypothetical protein [Alloactinosynnema sp. L-07]CRK57135.1 Choline-sulfatase [Alloactinosynnema sp. L-07]